MAVGIGESGNASAYTVAVGIGESGTASAYEFGVDCAAVGGMGVSVGVSTTVKADIAVPAAESTPRTS